MESARRGQSWNQRRAPIFREAKTLLVDSIVDVFQLDRSDPERAIHGLTVQFGTGSLHTSVAQRLIDFQEECDISLDYTFVSNNEELNEQLREARKCHPELFANTDIVSSGGTLDLPLRAYIGEYATLILSLEQLHPAVTVVTSMGLDFKNDDVSLTYKFERELPTQQANALRPCKHKIIAADASKIGHHAPFPAKRVGLQSLAESCDRLTFLVTKNQDPNVAARLETFVGTLTKIASHVGRDPEYDAFYGKEIELVVVDESTGDSASVSLRELSTDKPIAASWLSLDPTHAIFYDERGRSKTFDQVRRLCMGDSQAALKYRLGAKDATTYTTFLEFVRDNRYCSIELEANYRLRRELGMGASRPTHSEL